MFTGSGDLAVSKILIIMSLPRRSMSGSPEPVNKAKGN